MSWTDDHDGDSQIAHVEMPKPRKTKKIPPEAMVLEDVPPKLTRQNAMIDKNKKKRSGKKWFVDFQYYQAGVVIYPKEIAFISLDGASRRYLLVRVHKSADEANASTFNRQFGIHGIPWNEGTVDDWVASLKSKHNIAENDHVFVKGRVKAEFLRANGFPNTLDLDTEVLAPEKVVTPKSLWDDARRREKMPIKCDFHKNNRGMCAFANVSLIRKYYRACMNIA